MTKYWCLFSPVEPSNGFVYNGSCVDLLKYLNQVLELDQGEERIAVELTENGYAIEYDHKDSPKILAGMYALGFENTRVSSFGPN